VERDFIERQVDHQASRLGDQSRIRGSVTDQPELTGLGRVALSIVGELDERVAATGALHLLINAGYASK
jgi:hypothetical protein